MNTIELLGKKALSVAFAHDYYAWAEEQLKYEHNSLALQRLADEWTIQQLSADEIEDFFQQALNDLAKSEPGERQVLFDYAEYLCTQILDNKLMPKAGISLLEDFVSLRDRYPLFSVWSFLCIDIWSPHTEDQIYVNTGLTSENSDAYIRDICRQFITLLHTDLPEDFFTKRLCVECLNRYAPPTAEKYSEEEARPNAAQCPHCQSEQTFSMNDYLGRKHHLEHTAAIAH
ncbi:hypothetical protein L0B52_08680 [Suttonella sp. R2A3]|uniref:hypothetical protein n=1 Tax=Suttonella sp. R2A3 TaxID=2908648 RepID=UPI001F2B6114|nr:hypothetical protein [Suttonella sp. R2A3]UJF24395.1 hypothetical protein L0B52_08680 [Suttonella sp. R2A3]